MNIGVFYSKPSGPHPAVHLLDDGRVKRDQSRITGRHTSEPEEGGCMNLFGTSLITSGERIIRRGSFQNEVPSTQTQSKKNTKKDAPILKPAGMLEMTLILKPCFPVDSGEPTL